MDKSKSSNVEVAFVDNSSVYDKITLLKDKGFLNRTRWERASKIDVLEEDSDYLKGILEDKTYCRFERGVSRFGHTIEATLNTDTETQSKLYVTVATRKEDGAALSIGDSHIEGTKEGKNFVFSTVFPNAQVYDEIGKSGRISTLQGVQLFRYDPLGKVEHDNKDEIFAMYRDNYGLEVAEVYGVYFPKKTGFPHFHFCNRTMAELYGKSTEADAISLESLIIYIKDLLMDNDKNSILNNFDFGMPYLKIKNNPNMYKSSLNINALEEALSTHTVNKQVSSIFKKTQRLDSPDIVMLNGLEAVFADMVLLEMLNGSSGISIKKNAFKFIGKDDNKGLSVDSKIKAYLKLDNWLEDSLVEEVSSVELQLASKIATADKLTMKNSRGRDKYHFDDVEFKITDKDYALLYTLVRIIEKQRGRGGNEQIL